MNENEEPVLQEPTETIVAQESQQSLEPDAPAIEAPRRSQRVRKSATLMIMKFITVNKFTQRAIPLLLKKP